MKKNTHNWTEQILDGEDVGDVLKEGIKEITDKDLRKMASLTDQNEHNEALLYLYKNILQDDKRADGLIHLKDLFKALGKSSLDLPKFRDEHFYKPAIAAIKKKFGKEMASKVANSF